MAAPKGHPRYGGRAKGTVNKNRPPVAQKAEELGIDPYKVLLYFAAGDWKALNYRDEIIIKESKDFTNWEYTISPSVRMNAAAEACTYIHSKLKSIDHVVTKRSEGMTPEDKLDTLLKAIPILKKQVKNGRGSP